jgi:hypothetical protein
MPKKFSLIGLIFISALLSACSSKPTDDDLRKATVKSLQALGGKMAVDQWTNEIKNVRVLSCSEGEDKAYNCEIQGVMGPQRVRMIKSDDGWTVIEQNQ